MRSLNETVLANAARDGRRGARFARVPTGAETCTFCLMLASRSAVYASRERAGEFRHFHRGCDCKVVPGFSGNPDEELVEGVRPKELHEQWRRFQVIDSSPGLSADDRDEIKRRLVGSAIPYGGQHGIAVYGKPRSELVKWEKAGVDYLTMHGFSPKSLLEDPKAPANIDLEMGGALWEMKNLTNPGTSVGNQMKRARVKWLKLGLNSPMKAVFTCESLTGDFEEVVAHLEKKRRPEEELIVFSESGEMRRLK